MPQSLNPQEQHNIELAKERKEIKKYVLMVAVSTLTLLLLLIF